MFSRAKSGSSSQSRQARAPRVPSRVQGAQGLPCASAQGTIEYLVIVGVVVVVSLVVVGLVVTQTNSAGDVSSTSSQIGSLTGELGISEAVLNSDGNVLVVFLSNMSEIITLNSVTVNGVSSSNLGYQLGLSGKKAVGVNLTGLSCSSGGSAVSDVSASYTAASGLVKTKVFGKVYFSCSQFTSGDTNAGGGTPNSAPVVYLSYPLNGATVYSSPVDFNYFFADTDLNDCYLILDTVHSDGNGSVLIPSVVNKITKTLVEGSHSWDINCRDTGGLMSTDSNGPFNLIYDNILSRNAYFSNNSDFNAGNYSAYATSFGSIKPNGELDYNAASVADNNRWRDANLVAYYKFNSKNGTTIHDSAGTNNATLYNSANVTAQGLWDTNSLSLNGTNQYAQVSDNSTLDFTTEFTIMGWIYWNGTISGIIDKSADNDPGWNIQMTTGGKLYCLSSRNGFTSWGAQRTSTGALSVRNWTHFACTYKGPTSDLHTYVNGQLSDGSLAGTFASTLRNSAGPLTLGASQNASSPMGERLEEVKLYNRALTAAEIAADYNRGLFDANFGSKVIDTNSGYIGASGTDYNYLIINTNNGADKNGHIYASQIEPTIEKDLNSGLLGLWHFNGNYNDSSGNGHTAVPQGTAPTLTSGLWDTNAYSYPANQVSYFNVGNLGNMNTISLWLYPTYDATYNNDFFFEGVYNDNPMFYVNETSATAGQVLGATGTYYVNGVQTTSISLGVWSNVVIVLSSPMSASNASIGKAGGQSTNFHGKIEDVAIWNRNLSSAEIKELFNKGAARLGVKYRACNNADCNTNLSSASWKAWSDLNYSAGSQIPLSTIDGNQFVQYAVYPSLYRFPDGNYFPQAFATLRDVNIVYQN